MIENALLLRTNRGGRVYAGFEKLSAFQPVIDRYLRIADVSEAVYLFGKNDWRLPRHPNIRSISLNDDIRLARECFLIAHSSNFTTAFLATHDEAIPKVRDQQIYFALKTSDVAVVDSLTDAVECVIDWSIAA
jgi:DICT domain-containing protein